MYGTGVERGGLSEYITSQLALSVLLLTVRPLGLVLSAPIDGDDAVPGGGERFEECDEVLLAAHVTGQQKGGAARFGGRQGFQHGKVPARGTQRVDAGAGGGVKVCGRLMGKRLSPRTPDGLNRVSSNAGRA